MVKPNYSSVFGCDNRNNLTHVNNAIDITHGNDGTKEINDLLERYERILILAGAQIDIDEANTIRFFGRLYKPLFWRIPYRMYGDAVHLKL